MCDLAMYREALAKIPGITKEEAERFRREVEAMIAPMLAYNNIIRDRAWPRNERPE